MQHLKEVLQAHPEPTEELETAEQQVGDQGDINLCHYRVVGVSQEGLDLEVLLDKVEEDFNLPALLVDIGDGLGREPEGKTKCFFVSGSR